MQALAKLQICFQANPRDLDTLGLLARAFTQIGQAAKAIEVQKEMARIARDTGKTDLFQRARREAAEARAERRGREAARRADRRCRRRSPPPAQRRRRSAPRRTAADVAEAVATSYEDVGDERHRVRRAADSSSARSRRSRARTTATSSSRAAIEVVEEVDEPPTAAGSHEQIARILTDAASLPTRGLAREGHRDAAHRPRDRAPVASKPTRCCETCCSRSAQHDAGRRADDRASPSSQVDGLDGEAAARTLQEALVARSGERRAPEDAARAGLRARRGAGRRGSRRAATRGRRGPTPAALELRPGGAAPLVRPRRDRPGGRRARARTPSRASARSPAAPRGGPAAVDDMDDPFGDARCRASRSSGAPESDAAFELRGAGGRAPIRAPSRRLRLRLAARAVDAVRSTRSSSRRSRRPSSSRRAGCSTTRAPSSTSSSRACRTTRCCSSGWRSSTRRSTGCRAAPGRGRRRPPPAAAVGGPLVRHRRVARRGDRWRPRERRRARRRELRREQVDVEEVFAKFKEGVAKQIDVDDAQSHYDLGVAYKEMGLIDDALREFEVAARDAKRACVCHSMIGMIHIERGNLNEAIDAFMRGLQSARAHEGPGGRPELRDRRRLRGQEDDQAGARVLPAHRAPRSRRSATRRSASGASRRWSRSSRRAPSPWAPTTSSTARSTTSSAARARASLLRVALRRACARRGRSRPRATRSASTRGAPDVQSVRTARRSAAMLGSRRRPGAGGPPR